MPTFPFYFFCSRAKNKTNVVLILVNEATLVATLGLIFAAICAALEQSAFRSAKCMLIVCARISEAMFVATSLLLLIRSLVLFCI